MSSGKRKRNDLPSHHNAGGYIPQQDGAGDAALGVFEIEVFLFLFCSASYISVGCLYIVCKLCFSDVNSPSYCLYHFWFHCKLYFLPNGQVYTSLIISLLVFALLFPVPFTGERLRQDGHGGW